MVVPATLPAESLMRAPAHAEAAAILKLGRHIGKVRKVLAELGLVERAIYVEWASTERERWMRLVELEIERRALFLARARAGGGLPMSPPPVILVLGGSARTLANRLLSALPGAELHGPRAHFGPDEACLLFDDCRRAPARPLRAGRPIVGICAAGILIRVLAPLLSDKRAEPPVVAVAEDGASVVPLLGGHRGANALAREAAASARRPRGDHHGRRPALRRRARRAAAGLALANPEAAKRSWRRCSPARAVGLRSRPAMPPG